jgi:hypothetical protein
MNDPILAKAGKCLAAWNAFTASEQPQPEWEGQHNEVAGAWRHAWCDLPATVLITQQGAIALIDALLLYQEDDRCV